MDLTGGQNATINLDSDIANCCMQNGKTMLNCKKGPSKFSPCLGEMMANLFRRGTRVISYGGEIFLSAGQCIFYIILPGYRSLTFPEVVRE